MEIVMIDSAQELMELKTYRVEYLLWGTKKIPKTYGYLGFVPGDGFYLKMVCEEEDPLRTYAHDFDPVYRDSAMEAFFRFESEKERGEQPTYLNFEANANGALLAAYGTGRTYRTYFSKEEMDSFGLKAEIQQDQWCVTLRIPIEVLEKIYGSLDLKEGSRFYCNFYKISETKDIEHYASYSPIQTSVPSFHLPEFFAEARLIRKESAEK